MRSTIVVLALAVTGCATTPDNTEGRTAERCTVEECFRPRDVRRIEVLDEQNIVVYSGSRECPFRIEVRGFACDLDFAFDVNFVQREPGSSITGNRQRYQTPQRICRYTPRVEVFTGIYDQGRQTPLGRDDRTPGEECRVVDVDSLTDDELVELYVDRSLAPPPPPVSGGQLETPEQDDGEAEPAAQQEPGTTDEAGFEGSSAGGGQDAEAPTPETR